MSRGVYSLLIRVKKPMSIRIGALGVRRFNPGLYVYVGSAMGFGAQSLEGRIRRHLSDNKQTRWHIDYLLLNRDVEVVRVVSSETAQKAECKVVEELTREGLPNPELRGFGSSDCRSGCFSHLIYFGSTQTVEDALDRILAVYKRLGLKPRIFDLEGFGTEDLRKAHL